MEAQIVIAAWRGRARAVVTAIESFALEHASERGGKSAFVFTQGFIRDDEFKQADQAIEVAHRTDTALYFIDPRGLVAGLLDNVQEAMHGMDFGGTLIPVDSRVELSVDQATVGGWWVFSRELRLPSGPAQVRALVRDSERRPDSSTLRDSCGVAATGVA